MTRLVALLRAVNVGGRKVPMADLRALAGEIGLANPSTYIASGNLLFDADGGGVALEETITAALQTRFGLAVPVIVRDAPAWHLLVAANPFPEAAALRPNLLMMALSKRPLAPNAAEVLQARATSGEQIAAAGGALWFDYGEGIANSKITPGLIDRAAGSPTTGRNWRTAVKLGELLAASR